jgi:hypothetical protein
MLVFQARNRRWVKFIAGDACLCRNLRNWRKPSNFQLFSRGGGFVFYPEKERVLFIVDFRASPDYILELAFTG